MSLGNNLNKKHEYMPKPSQQIRNVLEASSIMPVP
jgi:hypothetical protein